MPIIPGDIWDISRSTSHVENLPFKSATRSPGWTGSLDPGQVEAGDTGPEGPDSHLELTGLARATFQHAGLIRLHE